MNDPVFVGLEDRSRGKKMLHRLVASLYVTPTLVALLAGCYTARGHYRYEEIVAELRPERPALRLDSPSASKTPAVAIPSQPMTLTDCIGVALANNPDIKIAVDRIRQAEATLAEASAAFLPLLATDTGFLRADAPSAFLFKTIDSRSFAPGTDFNDPGAFSNFETGVRLRYNLYKGGRDLLRRWVAQTGKSIQELEMKEAQNSLVASVIHAYYDIRADEESVRTAQASVRTVEAQHKVTHSKWKHGSALKSDVLSLEVRLAEAREQAIRADNSRKLAGAALAGLLGGDADVPVRLAEDDWDAEVIPSDYELALAEALAKRPELLRGRQMVEKAAMEVSSARRAYLPVADGSARVYWDDEHFDYDGDRTNWVAGVTLDWDLYSGGSRGARLARARAVLDEMLDADRKSTLAVQLDVKTSYLRVDEARARTEVSRASVEQAEETLSLVRKQYEGGTATVTRYLEAEFMLTQARMRETQAVYDLKKSLADAARAMGWLVAAECQEDGGQ